jgi:hypothetical protein
MPGLAALWVLVRAVGVAVVVVAGSVVVLLAAAYAAWPWTSATLAAAVAPSLGLTRLHVESARPGWRRWQVRSAQLSAPAWQARLADGYIDYRLRDLVDGRLVSVLLGEIDLEVGSAVEGPREVAPQHPAALFAALPAQHLQVDALTLRAPHLEFAARGRLAVSPTSLELSLVGDRPEAVRGLDLEARLTPDGAFRMRLEPPGSAEGPPPRLDAEGRLLEERVSLTGTFHLHGETLGLLTSLLGLPDGLESVSGQVDGEFPWPPLLREPWSGASAQGAVTARWQGQQRWGPDEIEARWRLSESTLSGDGDAVLWVAPARVTVQVEVDAWHLDRAEAAGRAGLGLEGVSAELAAATLSWRLRDDEATLEAVGHAGGRGWLVLQEMLPWLPGAATLSANAVLEAPWPLPAAFDPAALQASGELRGRWQSDDGVLGVDAQAAQWRWHGGVLSGEAVGTVSYDRFRVPIAVAVDGTDPLTRPLNVAGRWRLDGGTESPFELSLGDERGVFNASGEHRIAAGVLASWAPGWQPPFDATAGLVQARAELAWIPGAAPLGTVMLGLVGVDGHYGEVLLRSVDGVLELVGGADGWRLAPSWLYAHSLDAGVRLTDVGGFLSWKGDRLEVEGAVAHLLGGTAGAGPFAYDLATGSADVEVGFEGVSLAEVLALEGEHVTGTGTLRGELPVTISGHRPAVSGGRVRADAPGGVIRLAPALAGGVGQPGLDFALRALQNFTYTELEADVDYTADGDLSLGVRLRGRNPDVEGGRPIHYNLNVQENVPVLLESLRLQRRVTEGVERRMRN